MGSDNDEDSEVESSLKDEHEVQHFTSWSSRLNHLMLLFFSFQSVLKLKGQALSALHPVTNLTLLFLRFGHHPHHHLTAKHCVDFVIGNRLRKSRSLSMISTMYPRIYHHWMFSDIMRRRIPKEARMGSSASLKTWMRSWFSMRWARKLGARGCYTHPLLTLSGFFS